MYRIFPYASVSNFNLIFTARTDSGYDYTEENLGNLKVEGTQRSEFCTRAVVRRIEKRIEEETIRLATQDGESVLRWVNVLQARGHYILIKTSNNEPPPNSNLNKDVFILIIQMKYQQECWKKHGHCFAGIDAMHSTTHYENMSLFTLLVRDRWGHGKCYNTCLPVVNWHIYSPIFINYRHACVKNRGAEGRADRGEKTGMKVRTDDVVTDEAVKLY